MSNKHDKKVIVVGGGIIGVSVAAHLIRTGAQVTLVTERELCSGASGRSLSWLNSAADRRESYHHLRMAGIDRYRTLYCQQGNLDWLQFDGGVRWGAAGEMTPSECHQYERNRGYDSHLIDVDGVSTVDAYLVPVTAEENVLYNPGEGWVSLPDLANYLMDEFTSVGGTLIEHAGECEVLRNATGACIGVSSSNKGEYAADAVVLCCGPKTSAVVGKLGVTIPDGSPLSMLVTSKPVNRGVKTVLNTPRVAVRPNPGNRFVFDHSWYEKDIEEQPDGTCRISRAVVDELLGEAQRLMSNGAELEVESYKLGRKPVPEDGEPVIGELGQVPGCFVAFTHSGATLALIVGELLADEVMYGYRNAMLKDFRPERFG